METIFGLNLCDPAFPECIEPATISPWLGIPLLFLILYILQQKEK